MTDTDYVRLDPEAHPTGKLENYGNAALNEGQGELDDSRSNAALDEGSGTFEVVE